MICSREYTTPETPKGVEQKYCSPMCRNKAAYQRRESKIKNEVLSKISGQTIADQNTDEIRSLASWQMGGAPPNRWVHSHGTLEYLEKLYEAKNESNYLKMQVEKLTDELKSEREKNYQLEMELEELEDPDQDGGVIGNIMSQFQKDPANTITFAAGLLKNLFNNGKTSPTA